MYDPNALYHHGILGQKWGVRRYQNRDGSYTSAGQKRYSLGQQIAKKNLDYSKREQERNNRLDEINDYSRKVNRDYRNNVYYGTRQRQYERRIEGESKSAKKSRLARQKEAMSQYKSEMKGVKKAHKFDPLYNLMDNIEDTHSLTKDEQSAARMKQAERNHQRVKDGQKAYEKIRKKYGSDLDEAIYSRDRKVAVAATLAILAAIGANQYLTYQLNN